MRKSRTVLGLTAVLICASFASLKAASTEEALRWLNKLAAIAERGSYRAEYSGEVTGRAIGQETHVTMKGEVTFADRKHVRMSFDMMMNMPKMAPMAFKALAVTDGTVMWMELDNPMTGKQVLKVPIDKLEVLAAGNPTLGLSGQMGGLDPVSQVQKMGATFDFALVGRSAGAVTLAAELDEEALAQLGQSVPSATGLGRLTLVLDEETAFPREMRVGGETPTMVMRFENVEYLDRASLGAEVFAYQPPEGVPVIDIANMAGAGAPGGAPKP